MVVTCVGLAGPGCAQPAMSAEGPDPAAPPATARAVSATDFCGQLGAVVCEADRSCCGGTGAAVGDEFGDPTTPPRDCHAIQTEACAAIVQPLLVDPRTAYDPSAAGAYLQSLRDAAGACFDGGLDIDAFYGIFAGTGAAGADCTPRELAADDLRLAQLSCQTGLTCHLYLRADGHPQGICEPREDDACSHAFDCEPGRWCNLPADWEPGRWGQCQPLRADGWGCRSDLECAGRYCDPSGTCAAAPTERYCATERYDQAVRMDSPIGYWRLGDRLGTTASNESGPVGDGAYLGAPVPVTPGAVSGDGDGAVQLDGVDDHVRLPMADADLGPGGLSLECWFRRDDVDSVRPILEFSDGETMGVHVWSFDQGDKVFVNFMDRDGGTHAIMSPAGAVAPGQWYHVVATYDGAVARLFLNGEQVGELAGEFEPATDGALFVGIRPTDTYIFLGAIDEVAVYDHALPPARVRLHHALGAEGPSHDGFPLLRWLQ